MVIVFCWHLTLPMDEHMVDMIASQGKNIKYVHTNQLKFAFHFVVTDNGNSC